MTYIYTHIYIIIYNLYTYIVYLPAPVDIIVLCYFEGFPRPMFPAKAPRKQ